MGRPPGTSMQLPIPSPSVSSSLPVWTLCSPPTCQGRYVILSKLVFPALTQEAFVKALAGWGMNGSDFFALAFESCLSNLGGETAPPSGSLGSKPTFPGVGPHIPGFRAPGEESHQRKKAFYLWNFICFGLAASNPRLNKELAVRVPRGTALPRSHPHHSIALIMTLAPGSVVNGQYFPLPRPHFSLSGK